jgi:chromosome segregation ATPase
MKKRTNEAATTILGLALISMISASALARTDVKAKVEQLNDNVSASKTNLQQYESNLSTVVSNLGETERALKTIEKQKQAITKQTGQSAKEQAGVESAKAEVELQLKRERDLLTLEERQIEELKSALQRVEAGKEKRQANIQAYEDRLKAVETDRSAWTERSQSITDLDAALRAKEDEARAERKRLQTKRAEYEEEIGKWKKQVRLSERAAVNFRGLKEQ